MKLSVKTILPLPPGEISHIIMWSNKLPATFWILFAMDVGASPLKLVPRMFPVKQKI